MNTLGESAATGFAAPPHIDRHLRDAASVYADTEAAERILRQTLALDPQCLATYFSLYKFYFYKRRLDEAEHTAMLALDAAARQGGFSAEWLQLTPTSAHWSRVDGPQHFYLFTLKALAFMRLRLGRADEARALLAKLDELDPRDSVGANVIRALAARLNDVTP
jgi:tetratricopeptide (TPR) repeat protein